MWNRASTCLVLFFLVGACRDVELEASEAEQVRMAERVDLQLRQLALAGVAGPSAPPATEAGSGAESAEAEALATRAEPVQLGKKIIRNAEIRFRADDYTKTRTAVVDSVARHGGYVASEQESRSGYQIQNDMLLRIPAADFDPVLSDLLGLAAFVEQKNVTALDVTEQFVDLQARLATKREAEQSYRRILAEARSVEDVLAVRRELRTIREEIESVEGRLKYLGHQVGFSTIKLGFYQTLERAEDPERGLGYELGQALGTGLEWLGLVLLGLLYLWPFWLLGILVVFGICWRRRRKRKAEAAVKSA